MLAFQSWIQRLYSKCSLAMNSSKIAISVSGNISLSHGYHMISTHFIYPSLIFYLSKFDLARLNLSMLAAVNYFWGLRPFNFCLLKKIINWRLSQLHVGKAGYTSGWDTSSTQGLIWPFRGSIPCSMVPRHCCKGVLGPPLLPSHPLSFVCNLRLPGLAPRTLCSPAQHPYSLGATYI